MRHFHHTVYLQDVHMPLASYIGHVICAIGAYKKMDIPLEALHPLHPAVIENQATINIGK
jgi:hypothetical protein